MRFKRLDLNLLIALDAMLRERNISRAAERLHLSQSAMSNALARLREYFDDQLLVQVGRHMEPTPRAQALADAVRDVLVRVDTTIAIQPGFIPAESNRVFRLLVSEYTTTVLIPTLLALVWQESKSIGFELLPQSRDPGRLLADGEADILIMPQAYLGTEHPNEPLYEDDYVCVVWTGNTAIGETLSRDDYLAAAHVVAHMGPNKNSVFEDWFLKNHGATRNIQVIAPTLAAPCRLVVGTDRIATIQRRLACEAVKSLPLRILPTPFEVPRMVQSMQWHKYRAQDPGIVWLRERLLDAARQIG
ncbi:MAG: LysR family transcriptional regulator [Rhodocyclales bacterium GT-UBC]|nr:MAG: LysR family transcriptional regulator [Rhodocyclales bacterium GT-UBC]